MIRIVLSFDDGRKDNYRAAMEIMKPLNVPATFNITTGYVLKSIDDKEKPGPHEPLSLDELKELAAYDLFEIAGHGYSHDNDIDNLVDGVLKLRKLLPNKKINGVASPHSEFDLYEIEKAKKIFKENEIDYLRISNDFSKMGKVKIWLRRMNRVLHIPQLYSWVNKDSVEYKTNFLLHSFPVIRDNKLKEVKGLIDHLINNETDKDVICILMFHSILKPGEDYYKDLFSWNYDDYKMLCVYLSEQENKGYITIEKTCDVIKQSGNISTP